MSKRYDLVDLGSPHATWNGGASWSNLGGMESANQPDRLVPETSRGPCRTRLFAIVQKSLLELVEAIARQARLHWLSEKQWGTMAIADLDASQPAPFWWAAVR